MMDKKYCTRHETPMRFLPCGKVEHKGNQTVTTCGSKRSHKKHTHCESRGCMEVSGLMHPAYKWHSGSIA